MVEPRGPNIWLSWCGRKMLKIRVNFHLWKIVDGMKAGLTLSNTATVSEIIRYII